MALMTLELLSDALDVSKGHGCGGLEDTRTGSWNGSAADAKGMTEVGVSSPPELLESRLWRMILSYFFYTIATSRCRTLYTSISSATPQ